MRFRVRGADRRTGRDVAREYEAKAPESAAAFANLDGIVVANVELLSGSPAASAEPQPPAETLSYRSPTTDGPVPNYAGLSLASVVLRVYAGLCYVLGGLALMATIVGLATAFANRGGFGMGFSVATAAMPALALLFAAAVAHGLSAACIALRDIARNSWR